VSREPNHLRGSLCATRVATGRVIGCPGQPTTVTELWERERVVSRPVRGACVGCKRLFRAGWWSRTTHRALGEAGWGIIRRATWDWPAAVQRFAGRSRPNTALERSGRGGGGPTPPTACLESCAAVDWLEAPGGSPTQRFRGHQWTIVAHGGF